MLVDFYLKVAIISFLISFVWQLVTNGRQTYGAIATEFFACAFCSLLWPVFLFLLILHQLLQLCGLAE